MNLVQGIAVVLSGMIVSAAPVNAGALDSIAAGVEKTANWMQPDFVKGACAKTKWSDIGERISCGAKDIVARNLNKVAKGLKSVRTGNAMQQNDMFRDGMGTSQNSQNLLSSKSQNAMWQYQPGTGMGDLEGIASVDEIRQAEDKSKKLEEEAYDRRYIEGCMGSVRTPIENPFVATPEQKEQAKKDFAAQKAKYDERKSICMAALQNNKEGDKRLAEYLKQKPAEQQYAPSRDVKKRQKDMSMDEDAHRNQARAENPIEKPSDGRVDNSDQEDPSGFGNKVSSCMDIAIPVLQVIGYLIPAVANLVDSTKRTNVPSRSVVSKAPSAPSAPKANPVTKNTAPTQKKSEKGWDLGPLNQGSGLSPLNQGSASNGDSGDKTQQTTPRAATGRKVAPGFAK